jgi:hypothetical protein
LKPVTVKTAGAASEASFGEESTEPLEHVSETLTVVVSEEGLSEKSLLTVNVAERSVFVIVHGVSPPLVSAFEAHADSSLT